MSEIDVKYGLVDFGKTRELAKGSFEYIVRDIQDIRHRYIALGFHLHEFRRCGYYEDFGYPSFEEFCENNVPLDKSAISRCINVWYEFCVKDDNHIHCKNGINEVGCKMFLDEKYSNYSYSQLCEMLPLSPEQRLQVTPDMTVKSIRELKKKKTEKEVVCEVATSQPVSEKFEVDKNEQWIVCEKELPDDDRMVLVTCMTKKGVRSVNRAYYLNDYWHGSGSMSGVIAWMELPEPYNPNNVQ